MDSVGFTRLAAFLKANSGLVLTPDKTYLVNSRLLPVAERHACKSVDELVAKLNASPTTQLKQDIIEAMTTNETSFFRDITPFERFKEFVLPELIERRKARKTLRILCAAASTGQEPYSLAMTIAEMGPRLADWRIEIIGIDLDTKVIKKAEEAVYSQFEVQRGLPVQMLVKYFERDDQSWKLKTQIRDRVKFRRANLLEPLADLGRFDIIFCRNVLIYFDIATKREVLERLAAQITDDGYLFLGGAETVLDISDRFAACPGQRGIYLPQGQTKPVRAAG